MFHCNCRNSIPNTRFYLTTRDLYFTILFEVFTNISAENTYFTNHIEWAEHKNMGFKPANRYKLFGDHSYR